MNPRLLQRETIFSINSFVLGSAIKTGSLVEGAWDVKTAKEGGLQKQVDFRGGRREGKFPWPQQY